MRIASGQEFAGGAPDRQIVLRLTAHGWRLIPAASSSGGGASVSPFAIADSPAGLWLAGSARSGHGGYTNLVEHSSGAAFVRLATPNPTARDNCLWAIAPVGSGASAWAVGDDVVHPSGNNESVIEFGTKSGGWKLVPSPSPGMANGGNTILGGVLAFGPHDVWAVGTFDGANARQTLILHDTSGL